MNPPSKTQHRCAHPRRCKASAQGAITSPRRSLQNLPISPPNTDQFQSLDKQRTDSQLSQIAAALPTLQTKNDAVRKRRVGDTIDIGDKTPRKRAKLTAGNLKQLEIGGREKKSAAKSSGGSSTTTTTDEHFGAKLHQNGIIHRIMETQDADDANEIRGFLNRRRESEPPDDELYKRYLMLTEDYDNEFSVEFSVYPLLAKRNAEAELSGYIPRLNHTWSALDNNLTEGLNDAQPDLAESFCVTDYPQEAIEALSSNLAPSSFNESMATYAVEFKSSSRDMKEAKLQCACNGALMTLSAEAVHAYMQKPGNDFNGKTQAITVATNSAEFEYYGHFASQVPTSAIIPAATVNRDSEDNEKTTKYHLYRIITDHPRDSSEGFDKAYEHVRNAQDLGFKLASERKKALWEYSTSTSAQTNISLAPLDSSASHPASLQEKSQAKSRKSSEGQ